MGYFIGFVRSGSRGGKIAYMQGFFENVGRLDPESGSIQAPVVIDIATDFTEILEELGIPFEVLEKGPASITVGVPIDVAMKVPLLNPAIKNGKYYLVRSILRPES
jgi:hypothetical protein